MTNNLLTTAQAAQRLGLQSRQVINLINNGHLKAIRPGNEYLITLEALADYQRRKARGLVPGVGRPRKAEETGGET